MTGAGGIWIEQRIQEELEQRGETGDSLREIGRKVAAEVEKYFETKVSPGTILTKAARMNKSVSNETQTENPEITDVLGGGTGGLFPAETAPETPKVMVNPIAEIPKEVVKKKGSGTQPGLHCHSSWQDL